MPLMYNLLVFIFPLLLQSLQSSDQNQQKDILVARSSAWWRSETPNNRSFMFRDIALMCWL